MDPGRVHLRAARHGARRRRRDARDPFDALGGAGRLGPRFWDPILGILGLRIRDVMGYTFLVFLVLTPVVLALVTFLGMTLSYPL